MWEIACIVEVGKRYSNDDRASVNGKVIAEGMHEELSEGACMLVVCDGVGGEGYGNEAAEIVVRTFSEFGSSRTNADIVTDRYIKAQLIIAKKAVTDAQYTDYAHKRMATTVAGLYINSDSFIAFNVGDSRIYRYRNPYIRQLSKDHTARQRQLDLCLTPDPGSEHILTRCIGGGRGTPHIVKGQDMITHGDIFVLCSDGVWGAFEENTSNENLFEEALSSSDNVSDICRNLVNLALENGSTDNLSIIIARRVE